MKILILVLMFAFYQSNLYAGEIMPPEILFVGVQSGCEYNTLQDAIDDAPIDSEIRVSNIAGNYQENILIDKSLVLKGGYLTCSDAQLDNRLDSNKTTIDGMLKGNSLIIEGSNHNIHISGFEFINGINAAFPLEGGVSFIAENSEISLQNVSIFSNQGHLGGGLFISAASVASILSLSNTHIYDNKADNGGGIYCSNAEINIVDGSSIYENDAIGLLPNEGSGGGVFSTNCTILIDSGNTMFDLSFGIANNTAINLGGALYATEGSVIGSSQNPLNGYIIGNIANHGSAIAMDNDSVAYIQNSYILQNNEEGGEITNSVFHLNGSSTEANISYSTFADNLSEIVFSLENSPTLNLFASIINESSVDYEVLSSTPGSIFSFGCSIFHEGGSIGIMDPSVIDGDPGFVSPNEGNYHIRYDSIAVDRCTGLGVTRGDIVLPITDSDGDLRGIDIPNVSNGSGTYDVGADEYNDLIFKDNFENVLVI